MSEATSRGIWIITEEMAATLEVAGGKEAVDVGATYGKPAAKVTSSTKRTLVSAEDFKGQMGEFLAVVEDVFDKAGSIVHIVLKIDSKPYWA